MLIDMSERSQKLIAIYLHDLFVWMTQPATEDNQNQVYQSAMHALTSLLSENGVSTGYSQYLKELHKEIMQ